MNIMSKLASDAQTQKQILRDNKNEVDKWNTQIAITILIVGTLTLIPFIVVSFFVDSYKPMLPVYVTQLILMTTFLLLFKRIRRKIPSVCLLYIIYSFLVVYVTYSSAFATPDYASVLILLHLFQMPIITIDKSWRVNLIAVLYTLFYMIFAIPFKDSRLIADEFFNCLLFLTFGIILGESLRHSKLENLELKRQSAISEMTDSLTGLQNRKNLFSYLSELQNTSSVIGIIMIDIDCFKLYNDTYGHQAGDTCLEKIGSLFQNFGDRFHVRFYRYGGEEFLAVSTGYTSEELLNLCEKLNQAVIDMNIPHSLSEYSVVTISTGLSTSSPDSEKPDITLLLSQADNAMYSAKAQGKNRVVNYKGQE